ncbi:uncharacterized protein LOC117613607 isoform X4 [Prunus dulcis]|uniref:uncharacterized protein LOC117613607 isoform X4 n=1 Tax=Prunus dulcis TaxID=3755 RepID=UPI001483B88C|nr:uncharacterized protein LOC117613607 isoform X4 [Prunus dulcis]
MPATTSPLLSSRSCSFFSFFISFSFREFLVWRTLAFSGRLCLHLRSWVFFLVVSQILKTAEHRPDLLLHHHHQCLSESLWRRLPKRPSQPIEHETSLQSMVFQLAAHPPFPASDKGWGKELGQVQD